MLGALVSSYKEIGRHKVAIIQKLKRVINQKLIYKMKSAIIYKQFKPNFLQCPPVQNLLKYSK